MIYRFFFCAFIVLFIGCATLTDKLVFSENKSERKEAFVSLKKISLEEAQYLARDLKEIFFISEEKYRIRASYSLLQIALIMAKNNNPGQALDYCNFVLTYGLIDSDGLKADVFSRKMTPYFLLNLSYILPVTAGQRKTKTWILPADFFVKYKDKYKIKISKKRFFLINEALALNLLDSAFKDGNIEPIYDIINNYKNTYTYKTAEKLIRIITHEKDKNKGNDAKYILLNNNTIYDYYKKSVAEIDNFINKTSIDMIKK